MRRQAVIALGALLALAGCGDSEEASESSAGQPAQPTTPSSAKEPPLKPTLRELSGGLNGICERFTVRLLVDNYMEPPSAALTTCDRETRGGVGPEKVELDAVNREPGRAIVSVSAPGSPGSYIVLISDGSRWLIDGIAPTEGLLPGPRSPAITDGISAEALESFILKQHESAVKVDCSQVEDQDLGEWACDMTHVFRNRDPNKGFAVVTVAPNGVVSSDGFGAGSSVAGCCIEVAIE